MPCSTCDAIKHNTTYDLEQKGFGAIPAVLKTFIGWDAVRFVPEDDQDDLSETHPLSCPACAQSFTATIERFMNLDVGRPWRWDLTIKRTDSAAKK